MPVAKSVGTLGGTHVAAHLFGRDMANEADMAASDSDRRVLDHSADAFLAIPKLPQDWRQRITDPLGLFQHVRPFRFRHHQSFVGDTGIALDFLIRWWSAFAVTNFLTRNHRVADNP